MQNQGFLNEEINKQSFSNPHPWSSKCPLYHVHNTLANISSKYLSYQSTIIGFLGTWTHNVSLIENWAKTGKIIKSKHDQNPTSSDGGWDTASCLANLKLFLFMCLQGSTLRCAHMPGACRFCPRACWLLCLHAQLGKWFFRQGTSLFSKQYTSALQGFWKILAGHMKIFAGHVYF